MERAVGIDFGTTNSALAVAERDGARFASARGPTPIFRSILFFHPDERERSGRLVPAAGPEALDRWLEAAGGGRLMQSLKSFLSSRLFTSTNVFGTTLSLEALDRAPPARAPRGRRAFAAAGFTDVVLEYEPVAAAWHYERGLDHDELLLIGDFGGGTSDFCLLRVGPGVRRTRGGGAELLGTEGVGLAGDAFDGRIVRHVVAPALGQDGELRSVFGRVLPVPRWLYKHLERWHHLVFLRAPDTLHVLHQLRKEALDPAPLEALLHVVDHDLGFALHRAVEATKHHLSDAPLARLAFADGPIAIEPPVARVDFESWIAPEVDAIGRCVERLLATTGVPAGEVDRVFLTGGSSLVPAVRRVFATRFGSAKLRGGAELTSVASGLALRAAA